MSSQSKSALMIEEWRGAQRQTLIWRGVLHHDNRSTEVRVRNISATGAMIESPTPLQVGSEPRLEISDTVSVSATVEWTTGDQMGVSFHAPFDLTELVQARPLGIQPTWTPPTYLEPAIQAAWERRLRRLSPAQLRQEFDAYIKD
jgi:hypothetical protein